MLHLSPIKVSVFMSLFLCAGVAVFVAIHFMRLDKAIDLNDQMVILSLNVLQKHFFCCHANGKHTLTCQINMQQILLFFWKKTPTQPY